MKPDIKKSTLAIEYLREHEICIYWYQDGDEGAALGQSMKPPETIDYLITRLEVSCTKALAARKKTNTQEAFEEYDYFCVELATAQLIRDRGWSYSEIARRDSWVFGSMARARDVLANANAARRAAAVTWASEKPMPEWAVKALAAGWKAPKGWKP